MAPPHSNLHHNPSFTMKTTSSNRRHPRSNTTTSSSSRPNRAARRRNYVAMGDLEAYRETDSDRTPTPATAAVFNPRVPAIANTTEFPPIGSFDFQPPTPVLKIQEPILSRRLNEHGEEEKENVEGVDPHYPHHRVPGMGYKQRATESLLGRPGGFNETPEQIAAAAAKAAARKIHPLPTARRIISMPSTQPVITAGAAGTSLTHRSAEYDLSRQFERLKIQGQHLGLSRSPYFPRNKEELVRHREERKYDLQKLMKRRIGLLEGVVKLKGEGGWVKVDPDKALGGEAKGLWGVLAAESVWDRKGKGRAEWPTLGELKRGGRNGLPVPRVLAKEGTLGREVRLKGLDRVGFVGAMHSETAIFNARMLNNEGVLRYIYDASELEN